MYVKKTGLSLNFVIVNWLEALESGIFGKNKAAKFDEYPPLRTSLANRETKLYCF